MNTQLEVGKELAKQITENSSVNLWLEQIQHTTRLDKNSSITLNSEKFSYYGWSKDDKYWIEISFIPNLGHGNWLGGKYGKLGGNVYRFSNSFNSSCELIDYLNLKFRV